MADCCDASRRGFTWAGTIGTAIRLRFPAYAGLIDLGGIYLGGI